MKGKPVCPPRGYACRPTTDFAKEGLFNTLDNEYEFEGLNVLDLFSGTGGIAYEFASRGAGQVISIEMNPANVNFIKKTAAQFGLKNIRAVHHNVFDFFGICREKFDIVFADPPYAIEGLDTLPDRVLDAGIVVPDGYFILEHPESYSFSDHPRFVKEKRYSNVHFSFFTPGVELPADGDGQEGDR